MPKTPIGLADNFIYHVLIRGNDRQEVLHKERNYEAFNG